MPSPRQRPALLAALWAALLLCLLLAGAALRLSGLGEQSLWEDELFSSDLVRNRTLLPAEGVPWLRRASLEDVQPQDTFWTLKGADQSPPLFELAGKLGVAVLGDSERALRMTSALPAVLALAWLAALAWRHRGQAEGWVYAATLAMSAGAALLVLYAREARAYGLGAALITVLAVRCWQRLAHGWRQAPLPGWGEVALAAAASMAHYNTLALTGLMMSAYSLQALRRRDGHALLRMGTLLVLVLAWLWVGAQGFADGAEGRMGWVPALSYGQALTLVGERLALKAPGLPLLSLALAVLALGALAQCLPGADTPSAAHAQALACARAGGWMAVLAGVYVLLVAYVVHKTRIENARHLLFLLPLLFLVVGSALALVAQRGGLWRVLALALLPCLMLVQWPQAWQARHAEKSDYRSAAAFLLSQLQDGDTVFLGFLLNPYGGYDYYLGPARTGRHLRLQALGGVDSVPPLCPLATGPRVGVIHPLMMQPVADALVRQCAQDYAVAYFDTPWVKAQVWTRLPVPPEHPAEFTPAAHHTSRP